MRCPTDVAGSRPAPTERSRRRIYALALAALVGGVTAAHAQETTRCTKTTKLDGSGNLGNKTPRPAFKVNDVTIKKCLTVNKKTGDVKQRCTAKNNGSTAVKFLFCNMVELSSTTPRIAHSQSCSLGFDSTAKKWKCFPDPIPGGFTHPASLHFGCKVVDLKPSGQKGDSQTFAATGQSDDFKGKEAKDFQVSYADIFNLGIADQTTDCGFDGTTCATCFGKNTGTNYGGGTGVVPRRATATGYWIMSDVPITDPFVRWQESLTTFHTIEYAALDQGLAVPSAFPYELLELGRTFPGVEPPPTYTQDLLLWDIFTMSDPSSLLTPVDIEVFLDGSPFGVEVFASPSSTTIPGSSMEYGTITIAQPGADLVPEGTTVEWSIAFLEPGTSDVQLWEQDGRAIQDTVPPIVTSHSAFLDRGDLVVRLGGQDATTSVLAANLFYSVDGGQTWSVEPLNPRSDPLDEPGVNAFSGRVPVGLETGDSLRFFYNLQDGVLNHTWFGPGALTEDPIFTDGFESGDTSAWTLTPTPSQGGS